MPYAGLFWKRFVRWIGTIEQEDTYGGTHPSYTTGETLWGYFEPLKSMELIFLEEKLGRSTVKIHLHNYPDITDKDILQDKQFGDFWHVIGEPTYYLTEVVCLCYRGEIDSNLHLES